MMCLALAAGCDDSNSSTSNPQTTPFCGNGDLENGEFCDLGEFNDGRYGSCNPDCTRAPHCGDGIVQADAGEQCDNGTNDAGYSKNTGVTCNPDCSLPVQKAENCGNNELDPGEECDLGTDKNTGLYGACNPDCTRAPFCGDGLVQTAYGEECDLSLKASGAPFEEYESCSTNCKIVTQHVVTCGDGIVEGDEECDLGKDNNDGTECSENCKRVPDPQAVCGNGIVEWGEECDRGTDISGNSLNYGGYNGCNPDCTHSSAYCGNGIVDGNYIYHEECDLGEDQNNGAYGGCNKNCTLAPYCGDGVIQPGDGEACDNDSDHNGKDGICTADCLLVPLPQGAPKVVMTDPGNALKTNEYGLGFVVRFTLETQPTADVALTVTSSDATEGRVTPSVLTFSPENYNVAQTLTIQGVDDDIVDGDIPYTVQFDVSSDDDNYDNFALPPLSIINNDNDYTPGSKLKIRFMAANTTSGNHSSYDPGHGQRIFMAMKPDIALINEFNYYSSYTPIKVVDRQKFVTDTFGNEFYYFSGAYSNSSNGKPNAIVSRWPIIQSGSWYSNITSITDRAWDWAVIDLPGDRDLLAVAVHLHTSSNIKELPVLAQNIADKLAEGNYYLAVGGDFNTTSRASVLREFSEIAKFGNAYPVDQNGIAGTNTNRAYPYDWLIFDEGLADLETPVVIGAHTYPNGHVFDARVYEKKCKAHNYMNELGDVPPVQAGDSNGQNDKKTEVGDVSVQHMAVIRDIELPI